MAESRASSIKTPLGLHGDVETCITFGLTTIARPAAALRSVASIRKLFPNAPICVVIQGDEPQLEKDLAVHQAQIVRARFDVGVGAARNVVMRAAETPLVFILDDDFTIVDRKPLEDVSAWMMRNPRAHVVGGGWRNTHNNQDQHIAAWLYRDTRSKRLIVHGTPTLEAQDLFGPAQPLFSTHFVGQFGLYRRDVHLSGGAHKWDEGCGVVDHEDYFLNVLEACGGECVSYCPRILGIHHTADNYGRRYRALRSRHEPSFRFLNAKWGVNDVFRVAEDASTVHKTVWSPLHGVREIATEVAPLLNGLGVEFRLETNRIATSQEGLFIQCVGSAYSAFRLVRRIKSAKRVAAKSIEIRQSHIIMRLKIMTPTFVGNQYPSVTVKFRVRGLRARAAR